jgi:cephalosporin hydroxylase
MKILKKIKKILQSFYLKNKEVYFNINSIYLGHHQITYKGVETIKCPFDYVIYQMILNEIKPDLVIEIGTNHGGGALYIADILENIGNGIVHTIDIVPQANKLLQKHNRIRLFTDGWENYDLNNAKEFNKIIVIEDASHMYKDTLGAMNKFAPIVSKDSYLIVEDGIINKLGIKKEYDGGPLRAIKEFKNDDFVIDRKWCDFFGKNATFNVNGYLKKIK